MVKMVNVVICILTHTHTGDGLALTPAISECDFLWNKDLCRCNSSSILRAVHPGFGMVLYPVTDVLIRREDTGRHTQGTGRVMTTEAGRDCSDVATGQERPRTASSLQKPGERQGLVLPQPPGATTLPTL